MKASWRQIALATTVLVLSIVLGGCGGSGGGAPTLQGTAPLSVGYSFPIDSADLAGVIGLQRYAAATHRQLHIEQLMGATAVVPALLHGKLDMGSLNLPDAIKAIQSGAPLQVILGSKMFPEYVFVAKSSIARASNLRGAVIGSQGYGSDVQAFIGLILRQGGLSTRAAHVITIENSDARLAAFETGRIDATALRYHDYLRLLAHDRNIHSLGYMRSFQPLRNTQVWVVTDAFAKRNASALQTMVDDLLANYDDTYTPAGRSAWIANGLHGTFAGDSSALAAAVWAFYARYGMWPRRAQPVTAATFATMEQELLSTGEIARVSPFAAVWDSRFWDAAARS